MKKFSCLNFYWEVFFYPSPCVFMIFNIKSRHGFVALWQILYIQNFIIFYNVDKQSKKFKNLENPVLEINNYKDKQ